MGYALEKVDNLFPSPLWLYRVDEPGLDGQFCVAVTLGVLLVSVYEQLFVVVVVVPPEVLVALFGQVNPPTSEPDVTAELAAVEVA